MASCCADFLLGDVEDAFFGAIENEIGLLVRSICFAEHVVAGGDELPQQSLLANDLRVVRPVRS